VERSHRIDAEEFYRLLDGVVIDDTKVFNDKLQEWEDFYNYHRPHGSLGGQTPYERLSSARRPECKQPSSVAQTAVQGPCQRFARNWVAPSERRGGQNAASTSSRSAWRPKGRSPPRLAAGVGEAAVPALAGWVQVKPG
jgi:hypothetical protein